MIVSDAPSCGVTYHHHSDDSRGVIYDHNIFLIQATVLSASVVSSCKYYTFVEMWLGKQKRKLLKEKVLSNLSFMKVNRLPGFLDVRIRLLSEYGNIENVAVRLKIELESVLIKFITSVI